ncbi:hypothetical protein G3480_20885 [Thiorhodococcus mannitoliphagus]|uniref:Na+-dependent transporter n=1 Tax=Thiorhodococcus mannitoliphagus TaxID=329406 RepID=A0A6P1E2K2_9GAMM|nr:hypothetical protein [Thiorhodococcus mannitoliphagus]NEX22732.1 hypothetical protein [Thiorhodococcus mannitoliphagus]
MTLTLLALLKLSVVVIIFAIGLDSSADDLAYLWRRPWLLLRSVVAMYLMVPLAALLLVNLVALPPGAELGILVLAASAGAPLLPRKLMGLGEGTYTFSLVVTSSFLAIIVVPLWLAVLASWLDQPAALDPVEVAWVLAKSFLLPLAVGMLVRWRFPELAAKLSSRLLAAAGLVLTTSFLVLFWLNWDLLLEAGWSGALALAGLLLAALTIGHVLGGPAEDDRTALAIACSTRHLGVAILVAASLPGPRTAVMVAVYILVSAVVSIPYLRWRRRASARGGAGTA